MNEDKSFVFTVFPEHIQKDVSQLFCIYPQLKTFVSYYNLVKALSMNEELIETLKEIGEKVIKPKKCPHKYLMSYIKNEFLYLEGKKVHKRREGHIEELLNYHPNKYMMIKLKDRIYGFESEGMKVPVFGLHKYWNNVGLSYKEYFSRNHIDSVLPRFDLQIEDLKELSKNESEEFKRYILKKYEHSPLGIIGFLRSWYDHQEKVYKEKNVEIENKEEKVVIEEESRPLDFGEISPDIIERRLQAGKRKIWDWEWFWDFETKTFQSMPKAKKVLEFPVSIKTRDEYSERVWAELGC